TTMNVAVPGVPSLVSPATASTGKLINVKLAWGAVDGAARYRVQVSTSSTFSTLVVDDATLTATERQMSSLAYNTTYYWRVSASNVSGASNYSTAWSFKTTIAPPIPPVLSSPLNGAINQSVTVNLSWHASAGAVS